MDLESQTDMQTEQIERLLLRFVRAGDVSAGTQGIGQEYGGLEFDHLHVVRNRDLLHMLKIHVILLSLAYARRHLIEPLQHLRQFVGRYSAQQAV